MEQGLTVLKAEGEDEQKIQSQRQNLGRLQRGMRTPEERYYGPLLEVLTEMGGSAKVAEVLSRVGTKMKGILKPCDYEPLASGPDNPRWRNAVQWARNSMVREGLLKNDSPRGVWEISDKGNQWLGNMKSSSTNLT
jgi:restriction system protein